MEQVSNEFENLLVTFKFSAYYELDECEDSSMLNIPRLLKESDTWKYYWDVPNSRKYTSCLIHLSLPSTRVTVPK